MNSLNVKGCLSFRVSSKAPNMIQEYSKSVFSALKGFWLSKGGLVCYTCPFSCQFRKKVFVIRFKNNTNVKSKKKQRKPKTFNKMFVLISYWVIANTTRTRLGYMAQFTSLIWCNKINESVNASLEAIRFDVSYDCSRIYRPTQ